MDEKLLGKLIKRRHPDYEKLLPHWNFLELCYEGGRDWFKTHVFRYIKEGETEFADRVERAYRFNHSKEVVDLVGKYIFKSKIHRNADNAPDEIKAFWVKSNRSGSSPIQKFVRQIEKLSSVFGRIWVIVDNTGDNSIESDDDNSIESGDGIVDDTIDVREYAYIIKPQHLLDLSYDEDGNLNWILVYETARDDDDPFYSSGDVIARYRLWTKNQWFLIEEITSESGAGGQKPEPRAKIIDQGHHGLGMVPAFPVDHNEGEEELYTSPSLIGDIAYLDRACANYLSNLDAIIQDQTFSQLAMPAQGMLPGEDGYDKLIEMGTNRIFTYDGENGGQPFYLSPDPRQAEIIVTVIGKIINEIYHTVGMAGERTKQDNSIGIDNSSGVAKAYDFERVNALLTTKAASLRRAEIRMMELVQRWKGNDEPSQDDLADLVSYPETFDVRSLTDEFTIASNLALIEAPLEMRKEQLRVIIDKLFPKLKEGIKKKMLSEIDKMKDLALMEGSLQSGGSSSASSGGRALKGNRQGENNKEATN
ncbi:MAG: phage portal protein [Candidatus Binatia bacterium]